MADAIVMDRLTKYYGGRRAVNSLSLRVPAGSVYALLGRNGAGKSTTIRMLMGVVQPDFGRASILGEDVSSLSAEAKSRIAWVGEGHPMYRWMSVDQAVRFIRPFHANWNAELLDRILDHFEVPGRKRLYQLSNGQRAQVSLALAVAPDPQVLILDDPTLGLDTVFRRDFLESMIQIIQKSGRTILFSSHILSDVDRVADRIGIMIDGVLRVDAPTDHFRESVRKVVVEFHEPAVDVSDCPGLLSVRNNGKRSELVIVNFSDRHRKYFESLSVQAVAEIELNLEDAFVEYTRGPKGPLPVFDGETADG